MRITPATMPVASAPGLAYLLRRTIFPVMNQPLLASVLALAIPALSAEPPLDLTGVVKSADGRPLTNAHVFIYTAGPRVGTGYI